MRSWKTLSKETVLEFSKFLRVELHEVELHDGQVIPDWPWLVTPDFINVVAVTETGKFLCFRQTKYAVAGVTLAPVGGLSGARRRTAGGSQTRAFGRNRL